MFKKIVCSILISIILFFNIAVAVTSGESTFIYVGYKNMTADGLFWDGDDDYDLIILNYELDTDEIGELIRLYFETGIVNPENVGKLIPVKEFTTEKQYVKVGDEFVVSGSNIANATIKSNTYDNTSQKRSGVYEVYVDELPAELHFGEESAVITFSNSTTWILENGLMSFRIVNGTYDRWYYWNSTSNSWSAQGDFELYMNNDSSTTVDNGKIQSVNLVYDTPNRKTYQMQLYSDDGYSNMVQYNVTMISNLPMVFIDVYVNYTVNDAFKSFADIFTKTTGRYIPRLNTSGVSYGRVDTPFEISSVIENYVTAWDNESAYVLCYSNKSYETDTNTYFRIRGTPTYSEFGLDDASSNNVLIGAGETFHFGLSGFTFDGTENDDSAQDTDPAYGNLVGDVDILPNCLDYNNTATCTLWDVDWTSFGTNTTVPEVLCGAYGRKINDFDINFNESVVSGSSTLLAVQDDTYQTTIANDDFGITFNYTLSFYENTTNHNVTVMDIPASNGTARFGIVTANTTTSYDFLFNYSSSSSTVGSLVNFTQNWTKYTTYDFIDEGIKFNLNFGNITSNVSSVLITLTNISETLITPTSVCPSVDTFGSFTSCFYNLSADGSFYRGVQMQIPSLNGTGSARFRGGSTTGGINVNNTIYGNNTELTDFNVFATNGTSSVVYNHAENNFTIPAISFNDGDEINITFSKTGYENITSLNQAIYYNNITHLVQGIYVNNYFYATNLANGTTINSFTLTANNSTTSSSQATSTGELNWTMRTFPQGNVTLTWNATGYLTATNTTTVSNLADAKNISRTMNETRVFVNVFDENTLAEVGYFNLTVSNSTLTLQADNITEFNALYTNESIPRGSLTLQVVDTAGSYGRRKYYRSTTSIIGVNLTSYLVTNAEGQAVSIKVLDEADDPVQTATVSAFYTISGTVYNVDEEITDSTGSAQLFLDYDNSYTIMACKSGICANITASDFTSNTFEMLLSSGNFTLYNSTWAGITWSIFPSTRRLDYGNQSINITTHNSNMDYSYWGLWVNQSDGTNIFNQNSTTSDGGNLTAWINMSLYDNVTAYFFFKKANKDVMISSTIFYRSSFNLQNSTLGKAFEYLNEIVTDADASMFRDNILIFGIGFAVSILTSGASAMIGVALMTIALSVLMFLKIVSFKVFLLILLSAISSYLIRERIS